MVMRVGGFSTDTDIMRPFPEDGDGFEAILLAIIAGAGAGAYYGSAWWYGATGVLIALLMLGASVKLRLMFGDVYDPHGPWKRRATKHDGTPIPLWEPVNWFSGLPASATRFYCWVPVLPFVSVGIGRFGAYAGWKAYGFDSPEYLEYPDVRRGDVAAGSRALCFSIRLSTARPR